MSKPTSLAAGLCLLLATYFVTKPNSFEPVLVQDSPLTQASAPESTQQKTASAMAIDPTEQLLATNSMANQTPTATTTMAALTQGALITSPIVQSYINYGAQHPMEAFYQLEEILQQTDPEQGPLREVVFSLIIEIGTRLTPNSEEADQLAEAVSLVTRNELLLAEEIQVDATHLTEEQLEDLAHHGPYTFQDGVLYYRSFGSKYMALAALRDIPSEVTDKKFEQLKEEFKHSDDPIAEHLDMVSLAELDSATASQTTVQNEHVK